MQNTLPLALNSAAFLIPHPTKLKSGGEDAYFISTNNRSLGVADGVGGWARIPGSNASWWSWEMMERSNKYSYIDSPKEIAQKAFD